MLNYRKDLVLRGTGANALFAAGYLVTVFPVGAEVAAGSASTTVTVRAGHSFRPNDKFILNTATSLRTVSAITATTLTIDTALTVVAGDLLTNLGPDTGTTTPNYDASPVKLFSDPDGTTAISLATLTCDSQGEFEYYHKGDGRMWELIRSSSTVPVEVRTGFDGQRGRYNVVDFGAAGDSSTDDTTRIQAALDWAGYLGGDVYLPRGIYKTTGPLTLTWTSSPSGSFLARPLLSRIYGDGAGDADSSSTTVAQTEIRCITLATTRGVLELLGTGNTHAATAEVRDLRLRMRGALNSGGGTTSATAFCLRIGDGWQYRVHRVHCFGANGISVELSSSSSYATIGCEFDQVKAWTNFNNEWFTANDVLAAVYALKQTSGGAFWDTLLVKNSFFYGVVQPRGNTLLFENTMFSTNPDRNSGFGVCVGMTLGAAHFLNCYFEDYRSAIDCSGSGGAVIRNLTVDNCYFSSTNNTGTTRSIQAITLDDGASGFEQFTLRNCIFNVNPGGHSAGYEVNLNGTVTRVGAAAFQHATGLDDATAGGTYSGTRKYDTFEVKIDATGTPDTFKWRKLYSGNGYTTGVSITGAAQALSDGVTVTFAATTGHTLSNIWYIPVGFGGPRNVVIEDCSYRAFMDDSYQQAELRINKGTNFAGNYFIRHNSGKCEAYGEFARGLTLVHTEDTTALTIGASQGGIELQNLSGASVGSEGCESALTFRGIFGNPGSRYAAIAGHVTARNSTTQRESGAIIFATKTSSADSLTEQARIDSAGSLLIGTVTASTSKLHVAGNATITGVIDRGAFASFTASDASPTVTAGSLFKTANAVPTTITAFDNGVEGQEILVIINDANTTIDFTGTTLKGNAGVDWTPTTGDHMLCINDGTNWYCRISDNTA